MGSFDPTEVYGNIPKEKRRAAVARSLSAEVMMVAPSRLLALLGQSLKWQHLQGTIAPNAKFDLFRGVSQSKPPEAEVRKLLAITNLVDVSEATRAND